MKRREFITLVGGAAAWPLIARAQQPDRIRRIGVLMAYAEDDPEGIVRVAKFRQELERLGWSEGRNVRIDYRFTAARADEFQVLAKELVTLHPDVILAHATGNAAALQQETRAIPIVFVNVSDPIGAGFVTSLARPGGNLTGVLHYEASIAGKWLAMLKEIAPRLTRAALVGNPKVMLTGYDYFLRAAEATAPSFAIELVPSHVENAADIERAIESFARVPNGGLSQPEMNGRFYVGDNHLIYDITTGGFTGKEPPEDDMTTGTRRFIVGPLGCFPVDQYGSVSGDLPFVDT